MTAKSARTARRAVLGIDAAWTRTAGSGVALAVEERSGWRCRAVAPTVREFEALARGEPVRWDEGPEDNGELDAGRLLRAAATLAPDARVSVVTVDMPLAHCEITARRVCDNLVSSQYGARKCGTHSPSVVRPGPLSAALRDGLARHGFTLQTAGGATPAKPLLEVYPHTALLALTGAAERLPYKASKTRKYWPDASRDERRARLRSTWKRILTRLHDHLAHELELPGDARPGHLKRLEDALDSLVCAWIAVEHLAGRTFPLGDGSAAIWTPAGR